jgi:hypothetical protein
MLRQWVVAMTKGEAYFGKEGTNCSAKGRNYLHSKKGSP